jgi:hypothetical protein
LVSALLSVARSSSFTNGRDLPASAVVLQTARSFGTKGRTRPRDGAPTLVLGTLWFNHFHRYSAGHGCIAPSRREVGRGPAALRASIPGKKRTAVNDRSPPKPHITTLHPPHRTQSRREAPLTAENGGPQRGHQARRSAPALCGPGSWGCIVVPVSPTQNPWTIPLPGHSPCP